MSKPKPRTIAYANAALCHLQDSQGCLKTLATCLDSDGFRRESDEIENLRCKIHEAVKPLEKIIDGLKKALTNVGT